MALTYFDNFTFDSMEELIELIDELGFVPFFENEIEGFSLEEHIAPGHFRLCACDYHSFRIKDPHRLACTCGYSCREDSNCRCDGDFPQERFRQQ